METSPGHYHRYWLVDGDWPADEQGRKDFAGVMATMVAAYGSDKGAKDISRVLRVPGFLHRKNPDEPHMVAIVGGCRRRYTRAESSPPFRPRPRKHQQPAPMVIRRGHSEAFAELVRQVLTGEHLHPALTAIAWRQICAPTCRSTVSSVLRGIMLAMPGSERDERWHAPVSRKSRRRLEPLFR